MVIINLYIFNIIPLFLSNLLLFQLFMCAVAQTRCKLGIIIVGQGLGKAFVFSINSTGHLI